MHDLSVVPPATPKNIKDFGPGGGEPRVKVEEKDLENLKPPKPEAAALTVRCLPRAKS